MDFLKITNLCASKEAIQKVKKQPTEWKTILAHYISDKTLYLEYTQDFSHSSTKRQTIKLLKQTNDLHGLLSRQDIQMVNKDMKICQTSVVMMKMQIKATVWCPFTHTRIKINFKINF